MLPSHLGIDSWLSCCNCCWKFVQRWRSSEERGSSHLVFINQNSYRMILALTRTGAISPSGLYNFAISEDITLFVSLEVSDDVAAEKWKVSWSDFQTRPRILHSEGSISTVEGDLSSVLGRTSSLLLLHFCNGNLPASQSRISCWTISFAFVIDSAPPKTYLLFVIGTIALGKRWPSSSTNCWIVRSARNGAQLSPYVTVVSRYVTSWSSSYHKTLCKSLGELQSDGTFLLCLWKRGFDECESRGVFLICQFVVCYLRGKCCLENNHW